MTEFLGGSDVRSAGGREPSQALLDLACAEKGAPLSAADKTLLRTLVNGGRMALALREAKRFFDAIRPALFPDGLDQRQVDGINAKLAAMGGAGWPIAWTAYGLATSWWETGRRMQPVEEDGRGRGRPYGKPGRNGGQVPFGRGDVQLTHDVNYERADHELGLGGALIADYRLALDPAISARILVGGMEGGWFTGKRLAQYLPAIGPARADDFEDARRIINGTDKAAEIADAALAFQGGLQAGGWA